MPWIGRLLAVCVLVLCAPAVAPVLAADDAAGTRPARADSPRIGLALSGGGARGAAHVGVLRTLEAMRIPVDFIAGTSMGAIIGGLYAAGLSADAIEDALQAIDWESVFDDSPPRAHLWFRRKRDDDQFLVKAKPGLKDGEIQLPAGAVQGQNLDAILRRLTLHVAAIDDFDSLLIPFRAVATDIVSGEPVVLNGGELVRALRASMSIPAVFEPVEIDGRLLVDGGVSMNLPVAVVRDMGADVVIAVDVSTPLRRHDELDSPLAVLEQLTNILIQRNTRVETDQLVDGDVLIVPELGDLTTIAFTRSAEAVRLGELAARAQLDELARFSVPEIEYADRMLRRDVPVATPVVAFVELENRSRLSDELITRYVDVEAGSPLNVARLERVVERLYGLDYFKNVRYDVVRRAGQTGVVFRVEEKPWGPNYLQFGLQVSADLQGENRVNLGASYLRTAINDLGGEWRTTLTLGEEPSVVSDWYQPLGIGSRYFVAPRVVYEAQSVDRFDAGGDILTRDRVTRYGVELAAGSEFSTWGEARFGLRRLTGRIETEIGDPHGTARDFDTGEAFARFHVDTLDNFFFPRNGLTARIEYVLSGETLGADAEFEQVLSLSGAAWSAGRNTLLGLVRVNSTVAGTAPVQSRLRAGGFLNLSGLAQNQLSGQHHLSVAGVYYRRIGDFTVLPAYVGGSLEYGNVFEDDDFALDDMLAAGSLFFGLDTFFGPLYFAYGHAEGGFQSAYAFLGRPF